MLTANTDGFPAFVSHFVHQAARNEMFGFIYKSLLEIHLKVWENTKMLANSSSFLNSLKNVLMIAAAHVNMHAYIFCSFLFHERHP